MKHTGGSLYRLTDRIWVFPYEEERDRPNLGYIRGDNWSLAVDAGHSAAHVGEFYAALEREGLPLPSLTVLTHWHWDHTLAMHAAHGLTLACARTAEHLRALRDRIAAEGEEALFSLEESIRREYADGQKVTVTLPDLVFDGGMTLDAGNCPIRVIRAEAPHTDDSTLIHIPGEDVLFVGDAACGSFPEWRKDPAQARKLAEAIENTGAATCLEGHWTAVSRADTIRDLLEGEG